MMKDLTHFAKTISSIREICPDTVVESLIPDFSGNEHFIKKIIDAKPNVISHNLETVRRLSPMVRDYRANYDQSLRVLKFVKNKAPKIITKSSLMLGLGENDDEVFQTAHDLRSYVMWIFLLWGNTCNHQLHLTSKGVYSSRKIQLITK